MSRTLALDVEVIRVGVIDVFHDPGKVPQGGFNHQVVVICHQAVGVKQGSVPLRRGGQTGKEFLAVGSAFENILLLVPSGHQDYFPGNSQLC